MSTLFRLKYLQHLICVIFKGKPKYEKYPLKYLQNPKINLPFSSFKDARVVIIHDIDNLGFNEELSKMIEIEMRNGVTSILMLLPFYTLDHYKDFFDRPVGLHETFPTGFKKGIERFRKYGLKINCYSQHISTKETNFYPSILNELNGFVAYAFLDSTCFGFHRSYPLSFQPMNYRNVTLFFASQEPSIKAVDNILEACNKERGVVAFNFHPDYFSENSKVLLHLVKKLH